MIVPTTLFLANGAQAVRLPKAVAVGPSVKDVTILRDGPRRIIVPSGAEWDDFFAEVGVDLGARAQPPPQERNSL